MSFPVSYPTNRVVKNAGEAVALPGASGVPFYVGDHIVFFSGLAWPVSAFGAVIPWVAGSGDAGNQSGARATYVGISLSNHSATSLISGSITVITQGMAESPYEAASGVTTEPGSYVGFTQGQLSGYFSPQEVAVGVAQNLAIGKVVLPNTANFSGAGFASGQVAGVGVNTVKYNFQGYLPDGGFAL